MKKKAVLHEYSLLTERSDKVLQFMRNVMDIPPVSFFYSSIVSNLLGSPTYLQMEALLPLGNSSKPRSVSGIFYSIIENSKRRSTIEQVEKKTRYYKEKIQLKNTGNTLSNNVQLKAECFALLNLALKEKTLVAASTGSHARAVLEFANWLSVNCIAKPPLKLFVSEDISDQKLQAFVYNDLELIKGGDFTNITLTAKQYAKASANHIFIPTDPEDVMSPSGLFNMKDGAAGFATAMIETLCFIKGVSNESHFDRIYIPTSGGATWSACRGYLNAQTELSSCINNIIAVGDENALPVYTSLSNQVRETCLKTKSDIRPINGLFQKDMSAYAYFLTKDQVKLPEHEVRGVGWPEVRLAQWLIACDTGITPEPAGASALAAVLLEAIQANPEKTWLNLIETLIFNGYPPEEVYNLGMDFKKGGRAFPYENIFFEVVKTSKSRFEGVNENSFKGKPRIVYVSGANTKQDFEKIVKRIATYADKNLDVSKLSRIEMLNLVKVFCFVFRRKNAAVKKIPETSINYLHHILKRLERLTQKQEASENYSNYLELTIAKKELKRILLSNQAVSSNEKSKY